MNESLYTYLLADLRLAAMWHVTLTVLGVIAWPLVFPAFRRWPDRGLILSRPIGILLVGHLSWFFSATLRLPFSRGGLLTVALALAALSIAVAWPRRWRMWRELIVARRYLIAAEVLTILAFLFMVQVRRYDPSIEGTEKYMDLALFSSFLRETQVPPRDMWMVGGFINYHYGGYMLLSVAGKLLNLTPGYAYNLSVATVFALAVSASLVLGAMLGGGRLRWGVLTALATCCIGNLSGALRLLVSGTGFYVGDLTKGYAPLHTIRWTYCWQASRIIHDGPVDAKNTETINEFPFFSFIWADLHPHVTAVTWVIVFMALTYCVFQSPLWRCPRLPVVTRVKLFMPLAALAALSVGMLPVTNLFDLPSFAMVYLAGLLVASHLYVRRMGQTSRMALWPALFMLFVGLAPVFAKVPSLFFGPGDTPAGARAAGFVGALGVLGLALWSTRNVIQAGRWRVVPVVVCWMVPLALGLVLGLPFWLNYSPPARNIGIVGWAPYRSGLGEYLVVFGLHLACLLGVLCAWAAPGFGVGIRKEVVAFGGMAGALVFALVWGVSGTAVVPILLVTWLGLLLHLVHETNRGRPDTGTQFGLILCLAGMGLMLGCEFFYLVDNYGVKRMNTLFKFHYQAWLLLGIGLPALIRPHLSGLNLRTARAALLIPAGLLFIGSLVFPLSYARTLFDRRTLEVGQGLRSPNLDGQAYLTQYHADDWYVIDYVQREMSGRPVILEATGGAYRYESVLSANTGCQTVLGWENHENVWRGSDLHGEIQARRGAVDSIYRSTSLNGLQDDFARYGIEFVFVGSVERGKFPPEALEKFAEFDVVCRSSDAVQSSILYRVPPDWLKS